MQTRKENATQQPLSSQAGADGSAGLHFPGEFWKQILLMPQIWNSASENSYYFT